MWEAYRIFVQGGIDTYFRHVHPKIMFRNLDYDGCQASFCTVLALKSGTIDDFFPLDFDLWFRDRMGVTTEDERIARREQGVAYFDAIKDLIKNLGDEPPIFAEAPIRPEKSLYQELQHLLADQDERRLRKTGEAPSRTPLIWPAGKELENPDWSKYPDLRSALQHLFLSYRPTEHIVFARKRRKLEAGRYSIYIKDPYPQIMAMMIPEQAWQYTYEDLCATMEIYLEVKVLAGLFHARHLDKVYTRFQQIYDIVVSYATWGSGCWHPQEENITGSSGLCGISTCTNLTVSMTERRFTWTNTPSLMNEEVNMRSMKNRMFICLERGVLHSFFHGCRMATLQRYV